MPRAIVTLAALAIMLVPFADGAFAQRNPTSADQIIEGLRPRPGGGTTRGLRSVPSTSEGLRAVPSDAGATPQAATPPAAAGGKAPAAAAGAAPPAASSGQDADIRPSVNLTVQFATGSATLTPSAVRALNELGRALSSSALENYRFMIEGHTDTVGRRDLNLDLSERRAQAVRQYLISNFGIDPSRLDSIGRGQDELLIQTPDQTPEVRNRRVQIINLDG